MPDTSTRKRLTPKLVDQAKTRKNRELMPDSDVPGLSLKVTSSGHKSWLFRRRIKGGDLVQMTLKVPADGAHLRQARDEAERKAALCEAGKDPRREHERGHGDVPNADTASLTTLHNLFRETIAEKERFASKATARHYSDALVYGFERHALELLGYAPAHLSAQDITDALDAVRTGKRAAQAARGRDDTGVGETWRCWRALRHVLGVAQRKGELSYEALVALRRNVRVAKPKANEPDPLEPGDAGRLWHHLLGSDWGERGGAVDAFLTFLLATGCRPGEAQALSWGDIVWTGDRPKVVLQEGKNHRTRDVPMTRRLRTILERLPGGTPDAPVFSEDGRRPVHLPGQSARRARGQAARLSHDFDNYSLRDTVKNELLFEVGASPTEVNILQGHNLAGVDRHYIRSTRAYERIRQALAVYHARLDRLAGFEPFDPDTELDYDEVFPDVQATK